MKILVGTKRQIAIFQWKEQISKYQQRLFNDLEAFSRFGEQSDIEFASEDVEKLKATFDNMLSAMKFIYDHGIS